MKEQQVQSQACSHKISRLLTEKYIFEQIMIHVNLKVHFCRVFGAIRILL